MWPNYFIFMGYLRKMKFNPAERTPPPTHTHTHYIYETLSRNLAVAPVLLLFIYVVSWVRCGTWLYRFLIIALFLTLTIEALIMIWYQPDVLDASHRSIFVLPGPHHTTNSASIVNNICDNKLMLLLITWCCHSGKSVIILELNHASAVYKEHYG